MSGVLEGFLVIGAVIVVGLLVGRLGVLGPGAVQVLSRTAFFVASPALLFTTLAHAEVGAVLSNDLAVTAVTSSLACLLYVPFGLWRRRPPGEITTGAMASGYVNAGNLGLPVATYVFGDAAKVAPVLLFQLLVLTPVFTTVLDVLAERANGSRPHLGRALRAPLRNPLAVSSLAGIVVSATGWMPPAPVMAPIDLIAALAVPAMLLAFGISLQSSSWPGRAGGTLPQLSMVVLLKNVGHPLLALLAGVLLGLSGEGLLAVVVVAALPTAQNVFGYAVRFEQGIALARDAALTTTVLSLPMIFLIVAVLT